MKSNPRLTSKQREWLARVQSCRRSGQSVAAYARDNRLSAPHLYTWTSRLRALGALAEEAPASLSKSVRRGEPFRLGFSPVRLIETSEPRTELRIRFANGVILETSGGVDLDRNLLSTLASLS